MPLLSVSHSDTNSSVDLPSEGKHKQPNCMQQVSLIFPLVFDPNITTISIHPLSILERAMVYSVLSWRVVPRAAK